MAVTPPGGTPPQPPRQPESTSPSLQKGIEGFSGHIEDVLKSPHLVDSPSFLAEFANQVKNLHDAAEKAARG